MIDGGGKIVKKELNIIIKGVTIKKSKQKILFYGVFYE